MKKQQLHQPICTWNSLEEKQVIITKPAGTWKRRPVFTSQGGVKVFFGPSFPHSSGTPCVEFTHTHVIYIHTFSWQFGMGWRNFKLGTFVGSHLRSRWRFTTTLVPAPGPCRPSDGGAATVLYVNMFLVILKNMQKNHLPATLIKKIRMCFYIFFRTFGSIKWLQVRVTVILSHLRGLGSQCSVGWRCESPQNRSKMVQPFFFKWCSFKNPWHSLFWLPAAEKALGFSLSWTADITRQAWSWSLGWAPVDKHGMFLLRGSSWIKGLLLKLHQPAPPSRDDSWSGWQHVVAVIATALRSNHHTIFPRSFKPQFAP